MIASNCHPHGMASDNISFAPTGIESQTPAPTVVACEKKEHFISLLYLTGGRRCPFRAHTRSTKALLNLAHGATPKIKEIIPKPGN
jgi:hypothetical protein